MIRYDLICENQHSFDGWFGDSAAYDRQATARQVVCPVCGSTAIEKQLMTPGIPAKSNRRAEPPKRLMGGPKDAKTAALIEAVRQLRQHVEEHADYVGDRFAEEARRIHYEEVERRGIYGEATIEDARSLVEEGIEVHPLPRLPEETN